MQGKRTIIAGRLCIEAIYPMPAPRDGRAVRDGKRRISSNAQQRLNTRYAYERLELLLAANFRQDDLFITLTYGDDALPSSRSIAMRRMKAFLSRLRRASGTPLRYVYVTEHRHGETRWHHHMILADCGLSYTQLRKLWRYGNAKFTRIRIDADQTYAELAKYVAKEGRESLGARLWCSSTNLRKPIRRFARSGSDQMLEVPPEAMLLEDSGRVSTLYGNYRFIKYLLPES